MPVFLDAVFAAFLGGISNERKGGQIIAEAMRRRVMENKYCRGVEEERGRSERKNRGESEREREGAGPARFILAEGCPGSTTATLLCYHLSALVYWLVVALARLLSVSSWRIWSRSRLVPLFCFFYCFLSDPSTPAAWLLLC